MEHWPADRRENKTRTQKQEKGRDLLTRYDEFWRWPHLEHGSLGRTTLVSQGGHLKWSTVLDSTGKKITPLGQTAKIFPETYPPDINVGEYPLRKRFEHGLQYLRTYFPDADFPGGLVREEVTAQAEEPWGFDSSGVIDNSLEVIPLHHSGKSHVLFPMGDLKNQLNVSSLVQSTSGEITFRPSGIPSFTFETPILQICASAPPSQDVVSWHHAALVRTYSSVSLMKVVPSEDDSRSKVARDVDLTRLDTGDTPIVDARILGTGLDIIAVNRIGHVYKCNVYAAGKAMRFIEGSRGTPESGQANCENDFWQLGTTNSSDGCFLTSSDSVQYLDFRASDTTTVIYCLDNPGAVVTSYEPPTLDHLSRVTTTTDVIWLDDRYHRKPLLSFRHHRNHDRTIKTTTVQLSAGPLSLLTSRQNKLITVYDVNRGRDSLMHCNSVPFCLPWEGPMFTTFSGHAIIASPSRTELSLLRLTQRGSIYRQDVTVSISDRTAAQPANRTHEWDADVERLDQKAKDLCPYVGPVAGRHFTQVDLRAAYENISSVEEHNRNGADEVFCSALCRLPAIWEQTEAPVQEVLTMLDVIRAVEEQGTHSCAGFFGGRKLNYQRAFRALIDGNLPVQDVVDCTSWCYNLLDTLRRLPYDFSGDWSAFHERLKELEAISEMGKSGTPLRREREAREQLIVDLALSCDVFSHRPVSKPHSSDTGMTSATVSGTTKERSSEPAEVAFGYLKPIRNIGVNHYINADKVCMSPAEQDTEVLSPLGVRLLLAEWEVGSDIQNYIYLDPYNTTKSERKPAPPRRKGAEPSTPRAGAQTTLVPSQRPPTVIAAAGAPPAIKAHMELFGTRNAPAVEQSHSQETAFGHPPETFSQELMTSTQVLPGPYGGRVPAGKKKPAKKRMGGF